MDEKVSSFLQLAEEELGAAEDLVAKRPRQAAYFVAQAAEKAARALCEAEGVLVGTTHSLGNIASMLPPQHALKQRVRDLDYLSSASTRWRYPTPKGKILAAPSVAQLRDDIAEVERFIDKVKESIRRDRKVADTISEEQRKVLLVDKILAVAKVRNLDVSDSVRDALPIYADEKSLHEMAKAIVSANSFQDMLDQFGISLPKHDND